jgi:hypothetical protein
LESLIGFSLVTASITWIVLIYPALGRLRHLARHASALVKAQEQTGIPVVSGGADALLGNLAQNVIQMRVDLIHFPLIYYFRAETEEASLPDALSHLVCFAERASHDSQPERVRLSGKILQLALLDLAQLLALPFGDSVKAEKPPSRVSSDGGTPLDRGQR